MTIKVRPINAKPRRHRRQHSRRGGDGEWAGGSLTRNWPFRVSNEANTSIDRVSISLDRRALLIIHRKHSSCCCCCIMHYKFEGSNCCCCALLGQLLLVPQDMQVCVAATVHPVNNYMTGVPLFGVHTAQPEEVHKKLEWFFFMIEFRRTLNGIFVDWWCLQVYINDLQHFVWSLQSSLESYM